MITGDSKMNLENGRLDINGFEKEEKRNNEGKSFTRNLLVKQMILFLNTLLIL